MKTSIEGCTLRQCGGRRVALSFRLGIVLVLALGLIFVPLSSPSTAITTCSVAHCYSVMYNDTQQYGGLFYYQYRAGISTQSGAWHVSSEAWFANHCVSYGTWVELGIIEFQGKYEVFWSDYINGAQINFKIMEQITQNPNTIDSYTLNNNGDGTALIQFDSLVAYSDHGTGFNGSCIQEGGEVYSNSATTATFNMTGIAIADNGTYEGWGQPQKYNITAGMNGASYNQGKYQWNAP